MEWVIHIGMGKTGTSSIQRFLRTNRSDSAFENTKYVGLNFELIDESIDFGFRKMPWRSGNEIEQWLSDGFLEGLSKITDFYANRKVERLIWSNESLSVFIDQTAAILSHLKRIGCGVKVIVYFRSYSASLRSSYYQWGLKHKTYRGRLKTFLEWFEGSRGKVANYAKILQVLSQSKAKLIVRNYDSVDDVVRDFSEVAGLSCETLPDVRQNETPSDTYVYLNSMFNNAHQSTVLPRRFVEFMQEACFDAELFERFEWDSLFKVDESIDAVKGYIAEDAKKANRILTKNGLDPLSTDFSPLRVPVFDQSKVNMFLTAVICSQSERLKILEEQVAVLTKPKRDE